MKSWDKNWSELTTFFEHPPEIRKIIYTTNAVESYHRMVRKFTKSKAVFPTDDSIRKVIYMSVVEISKKWTMPIRDWGLAYAQFAIFFEDRFAAWRLTRALPSCSRGLSALGISGEKCKGSNISAAVLHRFIPQPASGRSSALPCSAAFLVLTEFWVLNAFTQFIFQNQLFGYTRKPLATITTNAVLRLLSFCYQIGVWSATNGSVKPLFLGFTHSHSPDFTRY